MQFDVSKVTALMLELTTLEEELVKLEALDEAGQAKIEKQIQKFHEDFAEVSRQLNSAIETTADDDAKLHSLFTALQNITEADAKLLTLSKKVEELAGWLFVSEDDTSSTASSVGIPPKSSSKLQTLFHQIDLLSIQIEDCKDLLKSEKQPLSEAVRVEGKDKFNALLKDYRKLRADYEKMEGSEADDIRGQLLSIADRSLREIRSILVPSKKSSKSTSASSSSSSRTESSRTESPRAGTSPITTPINAPINTQGEVIEAPWFYDTKGRSLEGSASSKDLEHNPIWVSHKDKQLVNSEAYFQKTRMTADVLGDGCCGYYGYAAILLQNAKESREFNHNLRSRIEALSMDWSEENIPFTTGSGKYTKTEMVNVGELKNLVLGMLEALEKDPSISIADFLDRDNGQILNLFFRAIIRKSYPAQISQLGASGILLSTLDEYLVEGGDLMRQYKEMENPILLTLNLLLGTDIGMMNFEDNRVTVMDKEGKEGNLIRVDGHFIYCLPRKE